MDVINIKNSSTFTHSLNGEHFNFGTNIVDGIAADIALIPDAQLSYNRYKEYVRHEGILFKISPESEETVKIATLNKQRVDCWRLVVYLLDYYEGSRIEAVRTAAKHLTHVLKTYKGLTDLNLFAKTGYIRDAIDALKESSAQAAVALIPGLLSAVNELEALNTELDGLYIKREQEIGLVRGLGTLSDYRPQVDKAFFDLIGDINSAYRRNEMGAKDPVLKAAIERAANTINSLYNKLHEILSHRHAVGKKKPQKPDITNPGIPGEGGDGGDGGNGGDGGEGGDGGDIQEPDIENPPPFGE